jgi:CRP-like cAMP-binding protein
MSERGTGDFLGRLGDEARARLLSVARPIAFMKGAALVRQGEPARGAWVIREGEVAAAVRLPGGENLIVGRLSSGSIFGEMALIERGTCTATVSAVDHVDGWFVDHEDFRALAAQRDAPARELQHAVTGILADRLRLLNAKVIACPAPEDPPVRSFEAGADPLAGLTRARQAPYDLRAFLPRLPAFERFSSEELDEAIAPASVLVVPRAQPVFIPGGAAEAAFVVVRGAVEVAAIFGGREKRLAVLGPGQLLGHMSVLERGRHSALACAREEAVLLEWPAPAFRGLYEGPSAAGARLRFAVQKSLLAAIASTNRALSRLISQAKLGAAVEKGAELEAALLGQLTN